MYEQIYDIRNFRDYSFQSSKMSVLPVDSRLQTQKTPVSGRDVMTSASCLDLIFKKYIDFFQKLEQRSILLCGGFLFTFDPFGHFSSRPCAILYVFE